MKTLIVALFVFCCLNLFYSIKVNEKFQTEIKDLKSLIETKATVTATMYYPVIGQCDSTPLLTAGMYKIKKNKASIQNYIALSRNLLKRWGGKFTYGDKVKITGAGNKDGIYTIVDTMNKRFVNKMDFLESCNTPLYKYNDVTITKINS